MQILAGFQVIRYAHGNLENHVIFSDKFDVGKIGEGVLKRNTCHAKGEEAEEGSQGYYGVGCPVDGMMCALLISQA